MHFKNRLGSVYWCSVPCKKQVRKTSPDLSCVVNCYASLVFQCIRNIFRFIYVNVHFFNVHWILKIGVICIIYIYYYLSLFNISNFNANVYIYISSEYRGRLDNSIVKRWKNNYQIKFKVCQAFGQTILWPLSRLIYQ